jgi:hypothetical protein
MSDPFGPHHGMTIKEYAAMTARGEKQHWTGEDERHLKAKVRRIKPERLCDYCLSGDPIVNGWHEIVDPEGIEGTTRVKCPNQ